MQPRAPFETYSPNLKQMAFCSQEFQTNTLEAAMRPGKLTSVGRRAVQVAAQLFDRVDHVNVWYDSLELITGAEECTIRFEDKKFVIIANSFTAETGAHDRIILHE